MSQDYVSGSGGGSVVSSVTGTNGVTASPTTGAVVVSGVDATTSTVGVASFDPTGFTVSGGEVSLLNGPGVGSVTAGTNLNNSGTTANPIINLDTQILQPVGSGYSNPQYSFVGHNDSGLGYAFGLPAIVNNGVAYIIAGFTTQIQGNFNQILNGLSLQTTSVTTTPYVVQGTDNIMLVTTSSLAITIQLPNSPSNNGTVFTIKDTSGNAGTHNITVTTVGGTVTIDAGTTYVIDANYAAITVIFDGTNYKVI